MDDRDGEAKPGGRRGEVGDPDETGIHLKEPLAVVRVWSQDQFALGYAGPARCPAPDYVTRIQVLDRVKVAALWLLLCQY